MQKTLTIRWKILISLLVLAIIPMLILTYLFSDIAGQQLREQIELMADQSGRYIMQGASQTEDTLLETLELFSQDEALLNAIYIGQTTEDPGQLHHTMRNHRNRFNLDKLELIHKDGHRHVLEGPKGSEPLIIQKPSTKTVEYKAQSDTEIIVSDNRLSISSTVPLYYQGDLIGNIRAYRHINDAYARLLQETIDSDIAFHDGEKIVSSSLQAFKGLQVNLDKALDDDFFMDNLNNRPHIIYNYPLNHEKAGFLIALDRSSIEAANQTMRSTLLMIAICVTIVAIVFGIFISSGIAKPLNSVVTNLREISEGDADLTQKLPVSSNDEIGLLASSFNMFVERLREIVTSTRTTVDGLNGATNEIRNRFSEISSAAGRQTKALEQAHANTTEIGRTSSEIADNVSNLVASVQQSAAATHELESTTHSIAEQMESLFGIISDISSSIHQLSSSNEQIDGNIIELSNSARETSKSAEELDQATTMIEKSTEQTSQLAQQATADALEGKSAVQDTIRGISELEEMMEHAYTTIQDLGERSDAIGSIINVIDEVADQTNLLALNAAIIAAQAGEHGQGFAVVAEEIRNLAERTSVSTKEIAEIIDNLQQGTKVAVVTIEAGTKRAQQEVARSAAAGEALEKLHESSLISTEQITGIAKQTQKQSEENRVIAQAVLGITKMLDQIATSIGQQTASTRNLSNGAESMKNIAAKVKNSSTEQRRGGQQIAKSMEHIQQMIELIDSATRGQKDRSAEVVNSVATVRQIAEQNAEHANSTDVVVESLIEHARLLQKEMGTFKIDEKNPEQS